MNNKELAIGVYKHPLIQEILKRKFAESSVVNRLIVEEIMMEDELEEAESVIKRGSKAYNALQGIKRNLRMARNNDKLDTFVKKYEGPLEKGKIPYSKWSEITDEKERNQILGFVRDTLEDLKKQQKDTTKKTITDEQMKAFLTAIGTNPKAYERISNEFNDSLSDQQKEILKKAAEKKSGTAIKADTTSDLKGLAKLLSEFIKTQMAQKAKPWFMKAVRKIPGFGQLIDYAQDGSELFGIGDPAAWVLEVLFTPVDWLVQEVWEKTGAEGGEAIGREILGEENYEKLVEAGFEKDAALDILKDVGFKQLMQNILKVAERYPDLKAKIKEIESLRLPEKIPYIGGYEIGKPFLKWLRDGEESEEEEVTGGWKGEVEIIDDEEEGEEGTTDSAPSEPPPEKEGEQEQEIGGEEPQSQTTETPPEEEGEQEREIGGEEPQSQQEVEQEVSSAIEAAPQAFEDGSPVEQQVKDEAIINNMDEFFGQTEGKPSFMNRFFLKDQAAMLYGLVNNLNQILGKETGEEGGEARALREQEEGPDHITIPWSRKGKTSLKKELGAFASLLREAKRLADAYDKYATQASVDPRYDGSSLKKALTGEDGQGGILGDVQWHTAKLADLLAQTIESYKKDETLDENLTGDEKREAISVIRNTYNKLGQMYINSLKPSLSGKLDEEEEAPATISSVDNEAAQRTAQEMLDLISKDPNIIKFFPRGIVNNQGQVVTLKTATKALEGQISAFGKVLRNIYMTTKDESIAPSDIRMTFLALKSLAQAIENSFGVNSLIKKRTNKILSKGMPESESSLTDEKPEETETEEKTYEHQKNEIYQKLTKMEQEAIDEFVSAFLEVSGSIDEQRGRPTRMWKKGDGPRLSKKLRNGLSISPEKALQILKKMGRTHYKNFLRTLVSEPSVVDMLVSTYGNKQRRPIARPTKAQPELDNDSEIENKPAQRMRRRIDTRRSRLKEEQIIDALKPIIENLLKEK